MLAASTSKCAGYGVYEIEAWVINVLHQENVINLSITTWEVTKRAHNYSGDVILISATALLKDQSSKQYNLVVKCGKPIPTLPVHDVFLNEIHVYDRIFPAFLDFQKRKNVEEPFDSITKWYGTYTDEDIRVIVLENLKSMGFENWNIKLPMSRQHLDLILKQYGKFHAISAAIKKQETRNFEQLIQGMRNIFEILPEPIGQLVHLLEKCIGEVYDLIKEDLDENIVEKWKSFKSQIKFILTEMLEKSDCFKVIIHADCWGDNFLFKNRDNVPSQVAILDWQLSKFSSPIVDVSYFIFSCISEDDLKDLDSILKQYHEAFSKHLKKLGNDPDVIFPRNRFLDDWKKFAKFGITMATLCIMVSLTDNNQFLSTVDSVRSGTSFQENRLSVDFQNKREFKNRMMYIVKFAADNDLI